MKVINHYKKRLNNFAMVINMKIKNTIIIYILVLNI